MEKWAFFLLSLVVGLLGIYFLQAQGSLNSSVNDSFSLFDRLLIGFYSLGVYLVKWIVPYEMAPMYPYPSSLTWVYYVMPLGIIALLGGLYVAYKKGYKALVFGAAFFLFNIFFVLQVLGAGQGFLADRFTYIPYLRLFFIMAWYFQWVLENRKPWATLIKGIAIAYLALFAVMTWRQIKIWENGGALWTHAIQVSEKNTTVWKKRGQYLRSVGQRDQAMADFNMALSLNPQEADLYNSRGKTYFDMGDANKALEDYSRAIQLDQSEAEFFSNRGAALGSLRRFNEAITDLNQAIQLNPDYTSAYRNRLQVLYELGRLEESLADHQVFLAQRPNDTEIVVSRAIIYQQLGRYQEALQDINRGIQLNGTNGGIYYQRALIQYDLGNIPAAKQDVQLAQKYGWQNIDPKFLQ